MTPLLDVRGLALHADTVAGRLPLVCDVDLSLARGKALALVGESGSGKSLTALAIARLLPPGVARSAGTVCLAGEPIESLDERQFQRRARSRIAFVFQDSASALDPLMPVGEQIAETLRVRGESRRTADQAAVEALARVGIPAPQRRARAYPHELSGGMKQRVQIAGALVSRAELLIADEPTTALDATVQAQILALLAELQRDAGVALLLITHDLGVAAAAADEIALMYAGRIVERAPAREFLAAPRHPYGRALLDAVPTLDAPRGAPPIAGQPPAPGRLPDGCPFHPRCPLADRDSRCATQPPPLECDGAGRSWRCWQVSR